MTESLSLLTGSDTITASEVPIIQMLESSANVQRYKTAPYSLGTAGRRENT